MKQTDIPYTSSARSGSKTERLSNRGELSTFFASVEQRAFVMARLSTRDDDAALDVVQDTMLRMVTHYAEKPPSDWSPLFFRVLANRLTDHHRRRGFARLLRWHGVDHDAEDSVAEPVDQLATGSPEPDEALEASRIGTAIRRALLELPERQRQVFILRQWQGMSVEETALTLGISGGSVKTHLSRALRALRASLENPAADESD